MFSSGDLVEDLTHNFFLETGARNGKLKVYETVEHPAARALTGFLLVRGGVHQVAYARALERLTGADLMKLFPSPRIPTDKIPECQPHIKRGDHLRLYRFSPDDYKELAAVFNGPHPETGEELIVEDESPAGFPAHDLPSEPSVFAPDYAPEEIAAIAEKLRVQAGLPKQPSGEVANGSRRPATKTPRKTHQANRGPEDRYPLISGGGDCRTPSRRPCGCSNGRPTPMTVSPARPQAIPSAVHRRSVVRRCLRPANGPPALRFGPSKALGMDRPR